MVVALKKWIDLYDDLIASEDDKGVPIIQKWTIDGEIKDIVTGPADSSFTPRFVVPFTICSCIVSWIYYNTYTATLLHSPQAQAQAQAHIGLLLV